MCIPPATKTQPSHDQWAWGPQNCPWMRCQSHQRELKDAVCPHKAGCKDPKEFNGFMAGDSAPLLTSTQRHLRLRWDSTIKEEHHSEVVDVGWPWGGVSQPWGHSTQIRCSWPTQNCKVSICPHLHSLELYSRILYFHFLPGAGYFSSALMRGEEIPQDTREELKPIHHAGNNCSECGKALCIN